VHRAFPFAHFRHRPHSALDNLLRSRILGFHSSDDTVRKLAPATARCSSLLASEVRPALIAWSVANIWVCNSFDYTVTNCGGVMVPCSAIFPPLSARTRRASFRVPTSGSPTPQQYHKHAPPQRWRSLGTVQVGLITRSRFAFDGDNLGATTYDTGPPRCAHERVHSRHLLRWLESLGLLALMAPTHLGGNNGSDTVTMLLAKTVPSEELRRRGRPSGVPFRWHAILVATISST